MITDFICLEFFLQLMNQYTDKANFSRNKQVVWIMVKFLGEYNDYTLYSCYAHRSHFVFHLASLHHQFSLRLRTQVHNTDTLSQGIINYTCQLGIPPLKCCKSPNWICCCPQAGFCVFRNSSDEENAFSPATINILAW
jgi:hypothetical protein